MNHKHLLFLVLLLSSMLLFAKEKTHPLGMNFKYPPLQEQNPSEENRTDTHATLSQQLRETLNDRRSPLLRKIKDKRFLQKLYQNNQYRPLWITPEGGVSKRSQELFHAIEQDPTIDPKTTLHQEYLYLLKYFKSHDPKRDQLPLELKLSQLHLDLLHHTLYGRINWQQFIWRLRAQRKHKIYANWVRYKAPYTLEELMLQPNILTTIQSITPKKFGYPALLVSLQELRAIQAKGGWKKLPKFRRLELGDQGDNVLKLRERLKASGDLQECSPSTQELFEEEQDPHNIKFKPEATFDECLLTAVKRFQKRHGLLTDGIVGPATIRSMNESVEQKIQRVLLNLDRIKWLPREPYPRYLVVNIPEYMLHYIEGDQEKEKMRVIVGDPRHPTPIFSNEISYVVLNPYWKVPEGIVKREIIPAMLEDPNYLNKQGLEIHETWSEYSPRIDPESIFWEDYADGTIKFPYRIMQPPGKKNALGKIKFKFPNRFDVYLHDTPTRYLFKRNKRAFSHGCVRLSEPKKLLEIIASFNPNIRLDKAEKILHGKRQKQIDIQQKLPIDIVYLTAGFDLEQHQREFRNDIYHYDKMQNVDKY